jgi:DNA mismatch repair protein MutL
MYFCRLVKNKEELTDLIHLLPDNIANQIAAGEVIQRPASAVKELLENAVDSGADDIRLVINDAGKSLVQVIDNGKGMSETDARMCFERHATSKITGIDDLFSIRTMGFRGEALASIAAVAQVEMKTRRPSDSLGTHIEIENSQVRKQEPCACPAGTSIAMKNLFFSVPARRNFLKSNASELRHIVDEFMHVALAFPEILFSLSSNGQEVYHLPKGNLKQRIIQLLGSAYASKLVGVGEQTDYLNIRGFVGKPDAAKKTRGEQYFFVNNRYIRSAYLNHAVMNAYQDMIPEQTFPLYVLFIDMDPAQLDINVHPTKQEIKFEDEKIVYAFVQAAVKHALAQYSVTPTLDFGLDPAIQQLDAVSKPFTPENRAAAVSSHLFETFTRRHEAHKVEPSGNLKGWKSFYEPTSREHGSISPMPLQQPAQEMTGTATTQPREFSLKDIAEGCKPLQALQSYLVVQSQDAMVIVNQQLAHERIIYERLSDAMNGRPVSIQRSLFPVTLNLSPADAALMEELMPDLQPLGYLVEPFGGNSFLVQGTPSDLGTETVGRDIESLLEAYKHFNPAITCTRREKLIRAMSGRQCVKSGTSLSEAEMIRLITDLANCSQPNLSVGGLPTYVTIGKQQLDRMFYR